MVATHCNRHGVWNKIDSLAKDGSQSWFVISSGDERLVTKLSLECTEPKRKDTSTLGTERPVPYAPWNVQQSVSSTQDDAHITIDQRKWAFIPKSDKVIETCFLVSKKMTNLLRHRSQFREADGAVAWEKLLVHFKRVPGQMDTLDTQQWIYCLRKGTTKIRFEYCLNALGKIPYMRALQGHSRVVRVDPTLESNVNILYVWTDHIYHVGASRGYRSIDDAGLLAGGTGDNHGRHTGFFAMIPDHRVRAAKRTNRWIRCCWWGRDSSSNGHLIGAKVRFAA